VAANIKIFVSAYHSENEQIMMKFVTLNQIVTVITRGSAIAEGPSVIDKNFDAVIYMEYYRALS